MTYFVRFSLCAAVIALGIGLTRGGGDKGSAWKPAIPEPAFKELVTRSAIAIDELVGKGGEDEIKRAQAHGVLIAAYAQSAKVDPSMAAAVRSAGLELAKMVVFKDKLNDAKKAAAALASFKLKGAAKADDVKAIIDEVNPLMDMYRTKSKGGEGIHGDLQVNIRLKGALNGIEEKVRAIASKKLSEDNVKKAAKELELLGYREAAMGALIHGYAPSKKVGAKDPQEWRDLSVQMRDAAIALAEAAGKKSADGIEAAASKLNSSCNQCHTTFRGQ